MGNPDYAALKKGGFMRQKQKDRFSLRLRVVGGQLHTGFLRKIVEVADKFGEGYIHLTSRQGVEIPFVSLDDIDAVKASLAEVGLQPGACGPRVRTVTACQGNAICPSGLIETSELAKQMDTRYFGRELPHKFKIGITGCPNNCLKAEENDLGVKGAIYPEWNGKKCDFCGLCESVCPVKAVKVTKGKVDFTENKCVYCGKCVKSCPSDAWEGKNGYLLSFGGMFGNEIRSGVSIQPVIFELEQVFKAVDDAIKFFEKHGVAGERMGKTIAKTGIETFKKEMGQ
ncbi:MAG: 4Fe-4S binding protein [Spirochaetaceae bacterium]|jgi:dissimilatory sulfite reductase (desulfoviridin) alpha/beta subunit|nr:4Fe-4S binding protein [Spirochaetaceae bacterium]